jgi:hypothetical protein
MKQLSNVMRYSICVQMYNLVFLKRFTNKLVQTQSDKPMLTN